MAIHRDTGKVGIGTTSPNHMLEVSGSTTKGGIVETGGVLKENLLTNSGFDVWSNSTLENVGSAVADDDMANDDTSDWTVDATLAFDGDHRLAMDSTDGLHGVGSWRVAIVYQGSGG